MKIKSLDITAFGKHKNLHMDFDDGLSVLYAPNEWGKTTVMDLIKMLFYGSTGKSSDIDKNPRKKYRPWNSDIMAGSITFSKDGKNFRLEREFKSSNSTDKISLVDLDTGEIRSLSGKGDIGESFFSLTAAALERSVFIGKPEIGDKNEAADGEINSRLCAVTLSGDDDTSFEEVNARIQKAKEELLSKSGKIGKCDRASELLLSVDERIKKAEAKEKQAEELSRLIGAKESELAEASKHTTELFDLLKNADRIKKKIFLQKYIEAENERARLIEALTLSDSSSADEEFLNKASALRSSVFSVEEKLDLTKKRIQKLESDIGALSDSAKLSSSVSTNDTNHLYEKKRETDRLIEEVQSKMGDISTESPSKSNLPIGTLSAILGSLTAVIGGLAFILSIYKTIGIFVFAIGLITAIISLILRKTFALNNEKATAVAQLTAELSKLLEEKQKIMEQIGEAEKSAAKKQLKISTVYALIEDRNNEKAIAENELKRLSEQYQNNADEFIQFVGKLSPCNDIEKAISVLEKAQEDFKLLCNLEQKRDILSFNANCSSLAEAQQRLSAGGYEYLPTDLTEQALDEIKERFKTASDKSGKIRSELSALKARLRAESENIESVELLRKQRNKLQADIEAYKGYCCAADIASKVLEEAFRELRQGYGASVDSRTAEIFAALGNTDYGNVTVSKNFEAAFSSDDAFGTKEADYLSAGTKDQLYLSLRLAVSELMAEGGEKLPIFMDDPLCNFDDNRAYNALSFLRDYSNKKQVILFTCHSYFVDMARELNITIRELEEQ